MKYYPALLNLKGKKCVVVGAGKVAQRKTTALLKAGAFVCVISPNLTKRLTRLKKSGKIVHIKSAYGSKYIKKVFLVIAATDNSKVNAKVYRDALRHKALVNVVDAPLLSNFIVPAVISHKDLLISISTSGKAPILSKKIKEDLKIIVANRYGRLLKILEKARQRLKLKYKSARKRKVILTRIVNSSLSANKNVYL